MIAILDQILCMDALDFLRGLPDGCAAGVQQLSLFDQESEQ